MSAAKVASELTYGPDGVYVIREHASAWWRPRRYEVVVAHLDLRFGGLPRWRADLVAAAARDELEHGRTPSLPTLDMEARAW